MRGCYVLVVLFVVVGTNYYSAAVADRGRERCLLMLLLLLLFADFLLAAILSFVSVSRRPFWAITSIFLISI
jgi:hypothetical protein